MRKQAQNEPTRVGGQVHHITEGEKVENVQSVAVESAAPLYSTR